VPGWDSLNHINIIIAVEKHFKVKFKSYELLRLKNVGELQKLVDLNSASNSLLINKYPEYAD